MCSALRKSLFIVIANEREAIQLESKEKARWFRGTLTRTISWIASLTLAMTVIRFL
jgi:hypothetical protein